MALPKYEYKHIKIADLLLNPSNPRFNPVKYQIETILAMVEDQQKKLVVLAEHIISNGLNPTEIILVRPHKNQWLVLEGNRRVAALKLTHEPDLVPTQYPKLKKDFQKLNDKLDHSLLENIPCAIITYEDLANKWIRLKHTGENQGAGTVHWNAQQTSRFNYQTSSVNKPKIAFLDALKNLKEIPPEYKDHFINIKKSNFDRLMSDPDVRNLLGVESIDGQFNLSNGINAYLLEVLYDLAFTDFKVNSIYFKDDRKKYISNIIERVEQKNSSTDWEGKEKWQDTNRMQTNKVDNSQSITISKGYTENDTTIKPTKGKSYPVNRKVLIPSQHTLRINNNRIYKIFMELKSLNVNNYPNAVAVLFRVFIELSADFYISRNNITEANNYTLSKKINVVGSDLKGKKKLTEKEFCIAKKMTSNPTQIGSVNVFHSYVHNINHMPIPSDLKTAWDNLWPFIDVMWR